MSKESKKHKAFICSRSLVRGEYLSVGYLNAFMSFEFSWSRYLQELDNFKNQARVIYHKNIN